MAAKRHHTSRSMQDGITDWQQPQCTKGVSGLLVTVDASVETGTAVEWECPYSGEGCQLGGNKPYFQRSCFEF